jgi:mannose/fructose/N-acetylgalactosamine-specific phosphotransferase system component IIC
MFLNILNIERIIKYILLGLIVLLAVRYIPENKLPTKELIMIGATSSIAFAILDMASPSITVENKKKEDDNQDDNQYDNQDDNQE